MAPLAPVHRGCEAPEPTHDAAEPAMLSHLCPLR
jgi:hypothetical protein